MQDSKVVEIDRVREKLGELANDARMNAHWHGAKDPIKYMVDMLIANGVTIPVRCKDCKHCRTASWGERFCARKQADGVYAELSNLRDDDYCSYGERRCDNEAD